MSYAVNVWSAIGLYPLAGRTRYFIGSPIFDSATIRLENGRTFTVVAHDASDAKLYVQSATLNGRPWTKATLQHHDIVQGGTLVLEMGPKPSTWASAPHANKSTMGGRAIQSGRAPAIAQERDP